MKIGIYSDLHCSLTSSIMPSYSDGIYTSRLNMIVKTGEWLSELFSSENVDMIVNCGDTFDSNVVCSEEMSAISEFFKHLKKVNKRHIIIVGNHEVRDVNSTFHVSKILSNIDGIEVYDTPCKINDEISVLPYRKSDDVTFELLESISNKIVFSHVDINGSHIQQDYIADFGVDKDLLSAEFSMTVNGHIHTHEVLDTTKGKVVNIGSVSSISFSDSNTYYPSAAILDTNTMSIKMVKNPNAIVFRRITSKTVDELIEKLKSYDKRFKYIVRATVPYEMRDAARKVLEGNDSIVASRVVSDMSVYSKRQQSAEFSEKLNVKTDMLSEFKSYLESNRDVMTYPVNLYEKILKELNEG